MGIQFEIFKTGWDKGGKNIFKVGLTRLRKCAAFSELFLLSYAISTKISQASQYINFRDGRILAAAGRSRFIHLWALDTRKLLRIVELPEKVTSIKQVLFLPDNFDGGASQVGSSILKYMNRGMRFPTI